MINDYTKRLEQLRRRRTDDSIEKAIVTESFRKAELGESIKYTLESMHPIDSSYTRNTFLASERVAEHIRNGLNESVEFRNQGSATTDTHIKLHSDIDLLVITSRYHDLEHPQVPAFPYHGNPIEDLEELRVNSFNKLNSIYDQVDDTNSKAIRVYPTSPKRMVDVVFANWYFSNDYQSSGQQELLRGVQIYDRATQRRFPDFPFLHIDRVIKKNINSSGGSNRLIRLLKTLKADADYQINLSSFELTCIVYDIDSQRMSFGDLNQLKLLPVVSEQLGTLITDKSHRDSILSPNGTEYIFKGRDELIIEFKKLKREVDDLIADIDEELKNKLRTINETINYN